MRGCRKGNWERHQVRCGTPRETTGAVGKLQGQGTVERGMGSGGGGAAPFKLQHRPITGENDSVTWNFPKKMGRPTPGVDHCAYLHWVPSGRHICQNGRQHRGAAWRGSQRKDTPGQVSL